MTYFADYLNALTSTELTEVKAALGAKASFQMLAMTGASNSVTGTVNETTLATYTVPANTVGANDALLIIPIWTYTNSANNKIMKIYLGGLSGTLYLNTTFTTSALFQHIIMIRAANATNSQKGFNNGSQSGIGSSTGSIATSARDMTVAQDIVFTGTLANTGETIALQGYMIALLRAP